MSQNDPAGQDGGQVISATRARQSRRNVPMFIVLIVSTLAAVVLVFGIWAARSAGDSHPNGGQEGATARDARTFNEPMSSPKQDPTPAQRAAADAPPPQSR